MKRSTWVQYLNLRLKLHHFACRQNVFHSRGETRRGTSGNRIGVFDLSRSLVIRFDIGSRVTSPRSTCSTLRPTVPTIRFCKTELRARLLERLLERRRRLDRICLLLSMYKITCAESQRRKNTQSTSNWQDRFALNFMALRRRVCLVTEMPRRWTAFQDCIWPVRSNCAHAHSLFDWLSLRSPRAACNTSKMLHSQ